MKRKLSNEKKTDSSINIWRARQRCLAFCIFYGFCVKIHRNEKKSHLDVDFYKK